MKRTTKNHLPWQWHSELLVYRDGLLHTTSFLCKTLMSSCQRHVWTKIKKKTLTFRSHIFHPIGLASRPNNNFSLRRPEWTLTPSAACLGDFFLPEKRPDHVREIYGFFWGLKFSLDKVPKLWFLSKEFYWEILEI